MRVLVTGAAGLLGSTLVARPPADVEVHGTTRAEVDLADDAAVRALVAHVAPDVVVHTAYGTADGERDIVLATTNVARAAASSGAALVHLSTDVVFDGTSPPYDEGAAPTPVTEYGRLKAVAEGAVTSHAPDATIVRTSLVVRTDPLDRNSAWVADAVRRGERPRLFVDELRCPIGVDDLAACVWAIATSGAAVRTGVWHVVGPEVLSRYALGLLITLRAGLDPGAIEPAESASHPTPRPRDVRLVSARAHLLPVRPRPVSALLARPVP